MGTNTRNTKKVYIISDAMLNSDSKKNIVRRSAFLDINTSIPLISDFIIKPKKHISTSSEESASLTADAMSSEDKNIIIDVKNENEFLELVLNGAVADIKNYLKLNNLIIYIASVKSILTNNVLDIYFHKEDRCFYIMPDLSAACVANTVFSNMHLSAYRLASLEFNVNNILTETQFDTDHRYYAHPELKDDVVDEEFSKAKTDVKADLMLLQGLKAYAWKTEYARTLPSGAQVNILKDTPLHIVSLDINVTDLFKDNRLRTGVIMQSNPYEWGIRAGENDSYEKIVFPIMF